MWARLSLAALVVLVVSPTVLFSRTFIPRIETHATKKLYPTVSNGKRAEGKFAFPAVIGFGRIFRRSGHLRDAGPCTGSVFHGGCVVTAAHCLRDKNGGVLAELPVYAGQKAEGIASAAGKISSVQFHPKADLAIFRLNRLFKGPQTFTLDNVPKTHELTGDRKVIVVGYGNSAPADWSNGPPVYPPGKTGTKHYGTTSLPDHGEGPITVYGVAAMDPTEATPEKGDSGGPLLTQVAGKYRVHGVGSNSSLGIVSYVSLITHRDNWLAPKLKELNCDTPPALGPQQKTLAERIVAAFPTTRAGFDARWNSSLFQTGAVGMENLRRLVHAAALESGEFQPRPQSSLSNFRVQLELSDDRQHFIVRWSAVDGDQRGYFHIPTGVLPPPEFY